MSLAYDNGWMSWNWVIEEDEERDIIPRRRLKIIVG